MHGAAEMQIREARAQDARPIVAWFPSHAEAIIWGGPAVPADFDAKWLAQQMSATTDVYRTACAPDGAIVGVYGQRPVTGENRLHIIRLGVAPVHRGSGIGRLLVVDALAAARTQGLWTVSLNVYGSNARAKRLYETLGFHATKTREAPEDPSGVSVYMERAIL